MFGSKLKNAVLTLSTASGINADSLGSEQVESIPYPAVEPWLAPAPYNSSKSHTTNGSNPLPDVDCLTIIGAVDEVHRQQIVKQIVSTHANLPVVVIADQPELGQAVGIMRQGAFAVASSDDPSSAISATVAAAATEGRHTLHKRRHILSLRERMAELTTPERQVLEAMLDGMANKQIAQALEIGLRTVELRRSKIMRKMGARNLAELVKFICLVSPSVTSEPPKNLDGALSPTA